MAASRYTVKLKVRPFYPWDDRKSHLPSFKGSLLYRAWTKFVAEQNEGWVMAPTGQPHVSQTVVAMALKEYGGRISKEQCTFGDYGRMQDWYRLIEFKKSEGLSMFLLRYGG